MMVESEAYELTEAEMLGAVKFGHEAMQPVIDLILEFAEDCAKEPSTSRRRITRALCPREGRWRSADARRLCDPRQARAHSAIAASVEAIKAALSEEDLADINLGSAIKKLESSILRGDVVKHGTRIDGRDTRRCARSPAKPASCRARMARALFTVAKTQGLVVTTLGTGEDEQIIDACMATAGRTSCCTTTSALFGGRSGVASARPGAAKSVTASWHGARLQAVLRPRPTSPIPSASCPNHGIQRLVLVASVCGGSLSMMDAGVPLKARWPGVAMGLILEDDGSYAVLTDILGDEDHLGDMDFKVAGTANGITSLQMDIKVAGITPEIMEQALSQAKIGACTFWARWPRP